MKLLNSTQLIVPIDKGYAICDNNGFIISKASSFEDCYKTIKALLLKEYASSCQEHSVKGGGI